MFARYHRQITTAALEDLFSPRALHTVIQANVRQDRWLYLLGAHPHHHFDDSEFEQTYAYLDEQREAVLNALANRKAARAWQAFGRITHALQDFYSHTNYLQLWLETAPPGRGLPDPEQVDPLLPAILHSPRLMSARTDLWREFLGMIPILGDRLRPGFPPDIHASMNLDAPERGPLFAHACTAARKRTRAEFHALAERIRLQLGNQALRAFQDR